MIDGDLQYPPEAIPNMLAKMDHNGVVIAERVTYDGSVLRRFLSRMNSFLFGRFLFGATHDFQSGLKVFRREIAPHINPKSIRPWSLDIPLIHTALELGYTVGSEPVLFEVRTGGQSKVRVFSVIYQILRSAFLVKASARKAYVLSPTSEDSMIGAGVIHKRKRFVTHTSLPHHHSALITFYAWQKVLIAVIVGMVITGLLFIPVPTTIFFIVCISLLYFFDNIFQFGLVLRSLQKPAEITSSEKELKNIDDNVLPIYSILCPLYKEAAVVPDFLDAMMQLHWPKEKLEVLFLLEETDKETIEAIEQLSLPEFVHIIVVPDSQPRTKPKACNYGLSIASGEYVVIYDAEDNPDPWQLKKAYLAFQKVPANVFCLQAKLNFYNPKQNILTRLFSAEYALWFDVILTGLQSVSAIIPLGGTSNHFRARDLRKLHGWDPFNVTEDCDLGTRLFKEGYKTAMFDSVTLEEANSQLWNWIRQRSRWIKGYMQTYLVHMRNPVQMFKELGVQAFIFQLVVGGKITFMLVNPILWITTILYFVFRATIGHEIERFYPPIVFYLAGFSLVCGNFLYLYYYMIGCARRDHWSLIKYIFLVPFYWLAISFAALIAFWQLFYKPHFWEKTHHGLHLAKPLRKSESVTEVQEPAAPITEKKLKSLFVGSGLLLIGMMAANVINFLFNAFLGRTVNLSQVSEVALVSTFWNIALLFFGAYSATINHKVSYLVARGEIGAARSFWRGVGIRAFGLIILIAVVWFYAMPIFNVFFQLSNPDIILSAVPIFVLGIILYTNIGYFEGRTWFGIVSVLYIIEALSKLVGAYIVLRVGYQQFVFLVVPFSIAMSSIASVLFAWLMPRKTKGKISDTPPFPLPFFAASLVAGLSATIFTSLDIVLARHYLEPAIAGEYALLALFGKIIFFLGSLPSALIITFTSRSEALKTNPIKVFIAMFAVTSALVASGLILLGPLGSFTAHLLLGDRANFVLPYLARYAFAIGLFTLSNTLVLYHVARKRYFLAIASLIQVVFVALALRMFHQNVHEMVEGMTYAGFASFITLSLLQLATRSARENIGRAWSDFRDLVFFRMRTEKRASDKKRILILNWRDTRHMYAGGAEKYIQDIAEEWVKQGDSVTLFCGNDGKSPRFETVRGLHIVRRGGFYLVYVWAFLYYALRFRSRYDIVVDCHNGIPFFTPLFVRKPVFLLIHYIHHEVFQHSLITPLAKFASFIEQVVMPIVYSRIKIITVSQSSKEDIQKLGMGVDGIEIVHPGIDVDDLGLGEKNSDPLVLYLGRLKQYKSLDVLLSAFKRVLKHMPNALLVIAGEGDELAHLRAIVYSLRIQDSVTFAGRISHPEKIRLLQRAWVVVNPSLKEGWGITTIEANACGTPVIASDVPGLRDSVQDGDTGYLVPYGDDKKMANVIIDVLENSDVRERMSKKARKWSLRFDYREASAQFLRIIYEKG